MKCYLDHSFDFEVELISPSGDAPRNSEVKNSNSILGIRRIVLCLLRFRDVVLSGCNEYISPLDKSQGKSLGGRFIVEALASNGWFLIGSSGGMQA